MSLSTLSNIASTNNKPCQYHKPEDWINWSHQFRLRAQTLNLWQYIQPEGPEDWPERPMAPLVQSYTARHITVQATVRTNTSRAKGKAPQEPGLSTRNTVRGHQDTPSDSDDTEPLVPTSISDLTAEAKLDYQHDWSVFTFLAKDFDKHQTAIKELTTWTLSTVSYTMQQTCCIENQTLDQWYSNLQETGLVYEENLLPDARDRYRKSVSILTKPPKSFESWITEWEVSMAEGRRLGVPDTVQAVHWAYDLAKALQQILNIWATNFITLNKDKINRNRLNFREIAGDLRRHWKLLHQSSKTSVVSKGAFPTFAETDSVQEQSPEPVSKARTSKSSRKSKAIQPKRKRQEIDSDWDTSLRRVCDACLCSHRLDQCYYVVSSLAPDDWKPNQAVKRLVEERIKEDNSLANRINKLKSDS
jgi:hypothetical protein